MCRPLASIIRGVKHYSCTCSQNGRYTNCCTVPYTRLHTADEITLLVVELYVMRANWSSKSGRERHVHLVPRLIRVLSENRAARFTSSSCCRTYEPSAGCFWLNVACSSCSENATTRVIVPLFFFTANAIKCQARKMNFQLRSHDAHWRSRAQYHRITPFFKPLAMLSVLVRVVGFI